MPAELPNALQLRQIKYGEKSTPARKVSTANVLLDAGRTAEALDLFLLAGDKDGVSRLRDLAIREGRPILLLILERVGTRLPPEQWKAAAEAAIASSRWRDAYRCYQKAGDEKGLEAVREHLPDYEIYTPQGK